MQISDYKSRYVPLLPFVEEALLVARRDKRKQLQLCLLFSSFLSLFRWNRGAQPAAQLLTGEQDGQFADTGVSARPCRRTGAVLSPAGLLAQSAQALEESEQCRGALLCHSKSACRLHLQDDHLLCQPKGEKQIDWDYGQHNRALSVEVGYVGRSCLWGCLKLIIALQFTFL